MIKKIREYIKRDPVSYIHIEELLDRDYKIEYASNNGFIIHDNEIDLTYISFEDEEEMKEVLKDKKYSTYLTYDKMVCDFYGDTEKTKKLNQYAYLSKEKLYVGDYDIRVLDESYIDVINKNYKSLDPNEDMLEHLKKGEMIAVFENNELAVFIGQHKEGCMGQLLVFDKYRKKGYAYVLEASLINKLINENKRIFNEVLVENDVSNHLQAKLGFAKGEKTIYWLVKNYEE